MSVFRDDRQRLRAAKILLAPIRGARGGTFAVLGAPPSPDQQVLVDFAEAVRSHKSNHHLFMTVTKVLNMSATPLRDMASEFVQAITPPGGSAAAMELWIEKWSTNFKMQPDTPN